MKKIYYLFSIVILCSCGGGKYNYLFDTGKQLDFGEGLWVLNRTESNSKIFDNELYDASYEQFKKILGDSLIDMNTLRMDKLISPKIGFELNKTELETLKRDTDCDFLINIRGNVISNGAGTVSFDSGNGHYSASNQSSVSIMIYDLNTGEIISSSQAMAKVTSDNSHFEDNKGVPSINSSAETLMVKAAKKLIKKYETNRLD
ncbi:hypothetical protein PXC01_16705 [Maribacter sp. M208]|uniref:hypothetical protein n=1 Tax=Maribacter huludaoensis TaxID=3030010 RepID=UPI0023EC88E0|nr:hypothetical protein [Maribacter huludaoensis]MDF4223248.1 hypothetical protein [Maribacter huludaoensis]